jgi:hypothetical protein
MWIKHYSSSRQSEYMSNLMAKYGWDGYGKYWGLLEYLAANYHGGEPVFHIQKDVIRSLFGVRSWNDLRSFVDQLTNERVLKFALSGNVYRIEAPILLDLLNRDFKRARSERAETAPRVDKIRKEIDIYKNNISSDEKKGNEIKEALPPKSATFNPSSPAEILSNIPIFNSDLWAQLYPDQEFLDRELIRGIAHWMADPKKQPQTRGVWAQKLGSWLENSWRDYKKAQPKKPVGGMVDKL